MEKDDKLEPHPLDELEDAAEGILPWMKNDPHTRRKFAEAKALLDGDPSEAGVEKQLQLMGKEDFAQKATPAEKCCQIFGWLLMLFGIGTVTIVQILTNSTLVSVIGVVMLVAGFLLNRTGVKKQIKRRESLSSQPQP